MGALMASCGRRQYFAWTVPSLAAGTFIFEGNRCCDYARLHSPLSRCSKLSGAASPARRSFWAINIRILTNERLQMRKSQLADLLSRRLGVRNGRLTSLVQRASEAGLLRTNASRRPDFDVEPIEAARMLILAIVDDGLAAAGHTVERYGQLRGRGANFEEALAHVLARPESLAPCRAGLELHVGDQPYAVLTTTSADGALSNVFGSMPGADSIDRIVTVSGGALFAIAQEIAGRSPVDVDHLIVGVEKPAASAVIN
jgi:hypothetical protein